jgi:hypothetical protein
LRGIAGQELGEGVEGVGHAGPFPAAPSPEIAMRFRPLPEER